MEAKFTPGPWTAVLGRMMDDSPIFGFGIFPAVPTRNNLPDGIKQHSLASGNLYENSAFGAFYEPDEIEANARLIAAAPDLLAELENLVAICAGAAPDHDLAIARARAAIAKALTASSSLSGEKT